MKILIIHSYYLPFFKKFLKDGFDSTQSFERNLERLLSEQFGIGDSYSSNLSSLGHETKEIVVNLDHLSYQWLNQNQRSLLLKSIGFLPLRLHEIVYRQVGYKKYFLNFVMEYLKEFRPDVLLIRNVNLFPENWLLDAKSKISCKIVGQVAYRFGSAQQLKSYDLIISSLPNLVEYFNKHNVNSAYLPHGFDERMLTWASKKTKSYPVSFVGGFEKVHNAGTKYLEKIAKDVELHVWSDGIENLAPSSVLRKHYHGAAWGVKLHNIYKNSKIVINRHAKFDQVKKLYANNLRMFEATGMGSLLVTDSKMNLPGLFTPDEEVVTYSSPQQAVEKIKFYLEHPTERKKIALRGRKRTHKDYAYRKLMMKLVELLR